MLDRFIQFLNMDSAFWFCAILGTGLFLLQFLLTFFGADSSDDGDGELDAGKIKCLSKQALAGFFMMFGWVGLACRKEFDASGLITFCASIGAGVLAVFINTLLFKGAKKLKSSGTIFRIEEAIGKEATVYQRIPQNGIGKVTVSLHQFTHEIDAISRQEEDLPSFSQVQIIKKINDNTVVVAPIK